MHSTLSRLAVVCAISGGQLAAAALCQAQPRAEIVEAVAGEPFGVGRIAMPMPAIPPSTDARDQVTLVERGGRVFYPAYESAPVRKLLRELIAAPPKVTVYFLFRGDAPLELTLLGPQPVVRTVAPVRDRGAHNRLLRDWWREFTSAGKLGDTAEPYPQIKNYLGVMLAQRMNLDLPAARFADPSSKQVTRIMEMMSGSETMRIELEKQLLLRPIPDETADRPLPEAIATAELVFPPAPQAEEQPDEPAIEPIAMHVPAECLYVRYGNFENFQWFRRRTEQWGGDIRNMISQRGVDYDQHGRLERQLALHESALAAVLGPKVIADVATIGTDTLMRDGAAMGILFQANNNLALSTDLGQQRALALQNYKDAVEEKIEIEGHPVSFIHTPDNRIRSFHAADGDFHFVTTSRALAERFLEAGQGKGPLGASPEFRHARSLMPTERNDSIFIYLSTSFMNNLIGPRYQIEMTRRLRSVAEMELLPIAKYAAKLENVPGKSIEQLVAARLLPPRFGQRPDGSRLETTGEAIGDSLRGARGSFVPVPDMEIKGITPTEARDYEKFAAAFRAEWGELEPVWIGLQRQPADDPKLEHVTIELQAAPFSRRHYAFLSQWLGPMTDQQLAPVPGDLVSVQAMMRGGSLTSTGDHQLFLGLRDASPLAARSPQPLLLAFFPQMQSIRGYVGAWPQPGLLRILGGAAEAPVNAAGFSQLRFGFWRRTIDQFTVLSFHPEVLDEVAPQLRFETAPRPAQLWVRVEDLAESKLAGLVNQLGYKNAQQTALTNARFLNSLAEQLHVPREKCQGVAESMLDAKLVSPLGGGYQLWEERGGLTMWVPAALAKSRGQARSEPPADYQFPALNWVRGMSLEARLQETSLTAHAELNLPAQVAATPSFQLPGFLAPGKKPDKTAPEAPKPRDAD